uniref:DNA-directed RNA polymerase, mitochondrial n=1 Tax=Petromyzon marinus TaxID=7757 RepID=A0AAJ7WQS3_PETMA|nr:DNA-directed RNA polymerase, mitochondrial [Petromyzon marinus]
MLCLTRLGQQMRSWGAGAGPGGGRVFVCLGCAALRVAPEATLLKRASSTPSLKHLYQRELLQVLKARQHQLQGKYVVEQISTREPAQSLPSQSQAAVVTKQSCSRGKQRADEVKGNDEGSASKPTKVKPNKGEPSASKQSRPAQPKTGTVKSKSTIKSIKVNSRQQPTKASGDGGTESLSDATSARKAPLPHAAIAASAGTLERPRRQSALDQNASKVDVKLKDAKAVVGVKDKAEGAKQVQERQQNDPDELRDRLLCYLDACLFSGELKRAQKYVWHYHQDPNLRSLLSVQIYDVMMGAWAKKKFLFKIAKLFSMVGEAGLKPSLVSYAAALECMGRVPNIAQSVVARCLEEMQQNGLELDQLFAHCNFVEDEREVVLAAVRRVRPDYAPMAMPPRSLDQFPLSARFYDLDNSGNYPRLKQTTEELKQGFRRQMDLEKAHIVTIQSVEALKPVTPEMEKKRQALTELHKEWRATLLQAFAEGKKKLMSRRFGSSFKLDLYPYTCLLTDEEYVNAMLESLSSLPPNGDSVMSLSRNLGRKVFNMYCIRKKMRNHVAQRISKVYDAYCELLASDGKVSGFLPRQFWERVEAEVADGYRLSGETVEWTLPVTVTLGSYLLDIMVRELKVYSGTGSTDLVRGTKPIPALYHVYAFRSVRQIGFVKPHPLVTQLQSRAVETELHFDVQALPTSCPPLPWTSPRFGGYVLIPTTLMRSVDMATQHQNLLDLCQVQEARRLHAAMDVLNQLGTCSWIINEPLLDIVIGIFNDRGCDKLDIPPPLSEAPKVPRYDPTGQNGIADRLAFRRALTHARKTTSEMHSLRMSALYKLSIANAMRGRVFWFPHNMDFRGRTYPCPPHFNHLGSDMSRALLLFAEGRPLGERGLDWIKIHLVNLTGTKKKSSLLERRMFADEKMDDILDSADRPLTGRQWWMEADEPWQVLACCMEIARAVRSPDPKEYISHFPTHQDGSCNGLQHYAALGRDTIGAASVNLKPLDMPQDVYASVAQQVDVFRAEDAKNDVKIAQVLGGFIGRKLVKQTVMTVVYGVTRYGGRQQIEKRLSEMDDFPKEYVWDASAYLTKLVFSSLREMFTGTREIQNWLTESARMIARAGQSVEWVTPLGLPIIQPYHRTQRSVLNGHMQMIGLCNSTDVNQKPNIMKQKNAFPPNFIHSLDSTHMMLTALYCYREGLSFASVHDCFWTHAATVDIMNRVCREQFVALHSQPILEDLSSFLISKYSVFAPASRRKKASAEFKHLMDFLTLIPPKGEFNLEEVRDSTYFFS